MFNDEQRISGQRTELSVESLELKTVISLSASPLVSSSPRLDFEDAETIF